MLKSTRTAPGTLPLLAPSASENSSPQLAGVPKPFSEPPWLRIGCPLLGTSHAHPPESTWLVPYPVKASSSLEAPARSLTRLATTILTDEAAGLVNTSCASIPVLLSNSSLRKLGTEANVLEKLATMAR